MTVTTLSLKFYISGHANWQRNMDQLSESVKEALQEKEKNISRWMTWILPKPPNKGKPIGYWALVNRTKRGWKVSATFTFAKTSFLATNPRILHYVTENETYCFFH